MGSALSRVITQRLRSRLCPSARRRKDRRRAKYELLHLTRVLYTGRDAHACIGYRNDAAGRKGVYIDQGVLKEAAARAITGNLRRLGPSVLPWSEMARPRLPRPPLPSPPRAPSSTAASLGAL
jgi:3-ketoacyl-CoA synthase